MKIEHMDNVQLLKYLMNKNSMHQLFILDAIGKMAEMVSNADKPEDWPDFINWDAWKKSAEDIINTINKRDGGSNNDTF